MMEYYNGFMYTHLPITLGKNTIIHLPISMCGCSLKKDYVIADDVLGGITLIRGHKHLPALAFIQIHIINTVNDNKFIANIFFSLT